MEEEACFQDEGKSLRVQRLGQRWRAVEGPGQNAQASIAHTETGCVTL